MAFTVTARLAFKLMKYDHLLMVQEVISPLEHGETILGHRKILEASQEHFKVLGKLREIGRNSTKSPTNDIKQDVPLSFVSFVATKVRVAHRCAGGRHFYWLSWKVPWPLAGHPGFLWTKPSVQPLEKKRSSYQGFSFWSGSFSLAIQTHQSRENLSPKTGSFP